MFVLHAATSTRAKLSEYKARTFLCTALQAYRLEPLVNPVYAQIRPVKVDSASSKPSKDAVDLAEGPKAEENLSAQKKSWFSGLWGSSAKKPSVEASKPKYPDKVGGKRKTFSLVPRPHPLTMRNGLVNQLKFLVT